MKSGRGRVAHARPNLQVTSEGVVRVRLAAHGGDSGSTLLAENGRLVGGLPRERILGTGEVTESRGRAVHGTAKPQRIDHALRREREIRPDEFNQAAVFNSAGAERVHHSRNLFGDPDVV